jgi:hypothetical protein
MVEFPRWDRLGVNDRQMAARRAVSTSHLRHGRQSQYNRSLPRAEIGEQNDPAVRKLDCAIVHRHWVVVPEKDVVTRLSRALADRDRTERQRSRRKEACNGELNLLAGRASSSR